MRSMSQLPKPCLFLDRDGVIIKNVPYSKDPETVELVLGIEQLITKAKANNFLVIVVTNQSGIGRGWLTLEDYRVMTERMLQLLRPKGAEPHKIYFAPYYEKSAIPEFLEKPHWRKPSSGMFEQASIDFQIDFANSVMVGDRASDLEASTGVGITKNFLLHSEDAEKERGLVAPHIHFQYIQSLFDIKL